MLKIRLQRVGKKHDPSFRVVLTDSRRAAKSGSFLDILGFYNARKEGELKLKGEEIKEWMSKGAQVSDTVHNLLVSEKIIDGPKINVLPPKKKSKEEKKKPEEGEKKEVTEEVKDAPKQEEAPKEPEEQKPEAKEEKTKEPELKEADKELDKK